MNEQENKELELIEYIASFELDPYGYVMACWDWGQGELAGFDGPEEWQAGILTQISDGLKMGRLTVQEAIQIAVASGHGIGKSALVAWIIKWAYDTREDTKGVITANTETQLKTKTWSELAKWHRLSLTAHWAELTATALFAKDPKREKTWRIDMVAWSERNTEAFAGLHNKGKRIILIFDEASAIPDKIWEVSEGALTDSDTEIIWCCFGNPTRNMGRFRECFAKFKHRWITRQIDSRSVRLTNKEQIKKWEEDYGEDSDFFRVRVKGVFPAAGANSLFGPDELDDAMSRAYPVGSFDTFAIIIGGDVARQGDDSSSLARRQGNVVFPLRVMNIPDITLVAAQFTIDAEAYDPDAFFVDATGGYGVGVIDTMRSTNHDCIEVYFSGKATDPRYFNKRSEMYFELAKWVRAGGALPFDRDLREELLATTYRFQGDKFRLCEKEEVKETIGRSPDRADAVALTFAYPVAKKSRFKKAAKEYNPFDVKIPVSSKGTEYDPYANAER